MNQKVTLKITSDACQRRASSHRLPSFLLATLVALTITASVACRNNNVGAQSNDAPSAAAGTQVEGTLVIDGKTTQLRYVYALRRDAPLPYKGAIVDLFIAGQKISDDTITEILAERYHGSVNRGIWLTFDPAGELKERAFFLESGVVLANGRSTGITTGQEEVRIEKDRVSGKLGYQNQGIGTMTTYTLSFDAPLNYATENGPVGGEIASGQGSGGAASLAYNFQTVTVDSKGAIVKRRNGIARYYPEEINGVRIEMVEIPAGSFTMGSSGVYEAQPEHLVKVPSFYIGKYEVTQAQWRAVANLPRVLQHLESEPSDFKGDDLPVESVSWDDAIEFCARLTRTTGRTYRLPTEAEWEYACRAGTDTPYSFGDAIDSGFVNYKETPPERPIPKPLYRARPVAVGSLGLANRFGLYDMHGNVSEWCMDPWHQFYVRAPADGSVWEGEVSNNRRLERGGSWDNLGRFCHAAYRSKDDRSLQSHTRGFRVVAVTSTEIETPKADVSTTARKPARTRPAATRGPGGLRLKTYGFETVKIDLFGAIESRQKSSASSYVEYLNGAKLEMVLIPAGAFKMGRSEDERAKPVHLVNVSSFYLGKYEVTQAQWRAVAKLPKVNRNLKRDPSHFKGYNRPVDSVTWEDAMEFCARLSRLTGRTYSLPTEAQWEFAARGGTSGEFGLGDNITPNLVNYDGRFSLGNAPAGIFRKQTTLVGSLGISNGFGLYDMDGNLREWCLDPWHESYKGAPRDGSAWLSGGKPNTRVTRGCSWDQPAHMCRVADRNWCPPDSCRLEYFGFRVAMEARRRRELPKAPTKSTGQPR